MTIGFERVSSQCIYELTKLRDARGGDCDAPKMLTLAERARASSWYRSVTRRDRHSVFSRFSSLPAFASDRLPSCAERAREEKAEDFVQSLILHRAQGCSRERERGRTRARKRRETIEAPQVPSELRPSFPLVLGRAKRATRSSSVEHTALKLLT